MCIHKYYTVVSNILKFPKIDFSFLFDLPIELIVYDNDKQGTIINNFKQF